MPGEIDGHGNAARSRIVIIRVSGRDALRQKHDRVLVLFQTNHGANVRMETRKDDLSRAAVLQDRLENRVHVRVQLERVIQLISTILCIKQNIQ